MGVIGTTAPAAVTASASARADENAEEDDARDLHGAPAGVGVVLDVVMTDRQLFGTGDGSEGDVLIGGMLGSLHHGDADLARQLAALTPADRLWIRRLYRDPGTGELVALDSRRRRFPAGLQRLIRFRDQHCRNPWCRAPIRHGDHARPWADGGPTTSNNGQGLCEACNYAKDAPGWHTEALDQAQAPGHRVQITTPTGHTYLTAPPQPPGTAHESNGPITPRILWTYRAQPTIEIVLEPPPHAA